MVKPLPRLKLQGFNNLTKALSFNIYDVCYAVSEEQRQRYIEYIDEAYNADRLTQILSDVAEIIGANILNIARQDYEPQGASVTILISEQPVIDKAHAQDRSSAIGCRQGLGTLIAKLGEQIPVSLSTPASRIEWSRRDVSVATPAGKRLAYVTADGGTGKVSAFVAKFPVCS